MRVLRALRAGSSWPVVAATAAGLFVVKLRGAAHGATALVAEIIVAELAERIGLQVPARVLIVLDEDLVSDDQNDELADLLAASHGVNLGFQFLAQAHDLRRAELETIDETTASRILWLDRLVMNPDRTDRNPNILMIGSTPWLIDHGSALGFHHAWSAVTEDSPSRPYATATHVLRARATRMDIVDEESRQALTREAIESAIDEVPDDLLRGLFLAEATADMLARRRAAYFAFLWKRLASLRLEAKAQSLKPNA